MVFRHLRNIDLVGLEEKKVLIALAKIKEEIEKEIRTTLFRSKVHPISLEDSKNFCAVNNSYYLV